MLLVYAQAAHFDFTSYDDNEYVTENALVRDGLTLGSIKGAFTTVAVGNWIPVTVLSQITAGQLFGMESGDHHLVNGLLHMMAAMLLMPGSIAPVDCGGRVRSWPRDFRSASTACGIGRVGGGTEGCALRVFRICGALRVCEICRTALDARLSDGDRAVRFGLDVEAHAGYVSFCADAGGLLAAGARVVASADMEKLPLLALSVADWWRRTWYRVRRYSPCRADFRLRVALEAPWVYLREMFWPAGLAVFYPLHAVAWWEAIVSGVLLAGAAALVVYYRRAYPYLLTGWFWFLGTLVPVCGIVQAGAQAHADRYTYIPMVGVLVMLAWGGMEVVKGRAAAVAAGVAVVLCMVAASRQAAFWQNSGTLFEHAIDVTRNNYVAESGLGATWR